MTLAGGYLNNAYGATISAGFMAVGGAGTIVNAGTILVPSTAFYSVYLGPGFLTNTTTGYIGALGVRIHAGGSVINDGRIVGGNYTGVYFNGVVGAVTNSGVITGGRAGVTLRGGGTVVNSGAISASNGPAIYFGGTSANRLVLDPGYRLGGVVSGSTGAGASNTLELAVGNGGAGTVSGLGSEFRNFGTVTVDTGATWILLGSNTIVSGSTLAIGGVLFDEGTLNVAANTSVTGVLGVGGGGTVEFQGSVGNGATISFGAGGTLQIDDLATAPSGAQTQQFNAPIAGLIDGDKLRIKTSGLGNFSGIDAATPGTFNGSTTPLVLTSAGNVVATLTLQGNYTGAAFGVSQAVGGFVTVGMGINAPTDFNGDGTADVLLQNDQNGQLVFAAIANGAFAGWGGATGGLGNWTFGGHGDVNGDGFSDAVVMDPNSGRVWIAEQNGSNTPTWVRGPNVSGWSVGGVGDIQGDDRADIVIQNASTGQIVYYDLKNNTFGAVTNGSGGTSSGSATSLVTATPTS